jgi:inhibitor of KinA
VKKSVDCHPLTDSACLIRLGDRIDPAVNRRVHALAALIETASLSGVIETVPAYAALLVHFDPLVTDYASVADWVSGLADRVMTNVPRTSRRIEVPVCYGGESGPDLGLVAASTGLSPAEVFRIHAGAEYTVYMMGFTPGFPYMGRLDPRLVVPRLETPRTLVKAGTVAIAGEQTGIYPLDSPGGWHLIGRTPLHLFDPASETPFLFAPGDLVTFVVEAVDGA